MTQDNNFDNSFGKANKDHIYLDLNNPNEIFKISGDVKKDEQDNFGNISTNFVKKIAGKQRKVVVQSNNDVERMTNALYLEKPIIFDKEIVTDVIKDPVQYFSHYNLKSFQIPDYCNFISQHSSKINLFQIQQI